ncbi:hypothetical protein RO3G_11659 [Rhizopus delemar RA 99-880]|uniref:Uncharacterized protein n=1 Tax=Rhizopus delemar (strain RA 99-880 / ATCC MYA-4621 / FGSC 9543 / NRRL 43880) TaxID=246409 RepID=I1CER8_RHIO9|nr:hypothetical protein RO3G_11659 [Rhizopus delemar RA 99-880]|eukprot:EIE86948.1 hypothetical protein RO3G_11659 [Rhizopus delemar RA 99-880]
MSIYTLYNLMKPFENFNLKNTPIGDFLLQERNLTMKKVVSHSVLGIISNFGVLNVELRIS